MKSFIVLSLMVFASRLVALDLTQATNSELLREVERRMGGTVGGTGAYAIYSCNSSTEFSVELFGQDGTSTKQTVYTGMQNSCEEFARDCTKSKARINSLTLVAACDSSTTLYRFPLQANGKIGSVSSSYIGSMANCLAQAKAINTAQ